MPLVAHAASARVVSVTLSDDDWAALKAAAKANSELLTLPGCGAPAYPRVSRLGLRHFAHKPGHTCTDHPGESSDHLHAKAVIVTAAIEAGWVAEPERPGPDWIADVYAENDPHKVALEVQWSRQTREEYDRRQARYAADGVRGAWFARHDTSIPVTPDRALPLFLLGRHDDGEFRVRVNSREESMSLHDAVIALLGGRIQHRTRVGAGTAARVQVDVYAYPCWSCGQDSTIWAVGDTTATGSCGTTAVEHPDGALWGDTRPEADMEVRSAVRTAAVNGSLPPVANIGRRASKTTGTTYVAFSCPHCERIFGDWPLREWLLERAYDPDGPDLQLTVDGPTTGLDHPHWCVNHGQGHCYS